ncbi:hypothetical protein SCLCIDRAFT_1224921 [Scleroderma citrinum Foug A]|uniref:Uncharacterized protein n=1 Tax=Scleroderma citrinum Foug A TaxID=1036808 RepID=A0A0C3CQY9_9AGAM|nr:hypothetical protein SCLCIDRAFT_1224921 [Scleroderma citrinum Foug A]
MSKENKVCAVDWEKAKIDCHATNRLLFGSTKWSELSKNSHGRFYLGLECRSQQLATVPYLVAQRIAAQLLHSTLTSIPMEPRSLVRTKFDP